VNIGWLISRANNLNYRGTSIGRQRPIRGRGAARLRDFEAAVFG
jgi:hypothetical protein